MSVPAFRLTRLGRASMLSVLLLGVGICPLWADFQETATFTAEHLEVENLIGAIRVEGHRGDAFEVRVSVEGKDASKDLIRIDTTQGREARLVVVFPVDRHRDYVYPAMQSGNRTTFRRDSGWFGDLVDGLLDRKIEVRKSGDGLQVWADVTIKVPQGSSLKVQQGIGGIVAANVDANLSLASRSGAIEASDVRGDLLADTGSGDVVAAHVDGRVTIDTGSGDVELKNATGKQVSVDTGSGDVRVDSVDAPRIVIDTGSGDVRASGIRTDGAHIDTGSGSVTLMLDRMGRGDYKIDTGSGRIHLGLPADASARVRAETGSGSIDIDLDDGARMTREEKDEVEFVVGSGDARIDLDTGSGGIRVSRR